jgi:hypothetical protein
MVFVFSIVAPPTEPTLAAGCANNQECPDHAACENRLCINPCAYDNPCAPNANCRVVNHEPVCTCPDGYIGSPETSCELRKIYILQYYKNTLHKLRYLIICDN